MTQEWFFAYTYVYMYRFMYTHTLTLFKNSLNCRVWPPFCSIRSSAVGFRLAVNHTRLVFTQPNLRILEKGYTASNNTASVEGAYEGLEAPRHSFLCPRPSSLGKYVVMSDEAEWARTVSAWESHQPWVYLVSYVSPLVVCVQLVSHLVSSGEGDSHPISSSGASPQCLVLITQWTIPRMKYKGLVRYTGLSRILIYFESEFISYLGVEGRKIAPKDVHIIISGTCEDAALHGTGTLLIWSS